MSTYMTLRECWDAYLFESPRRFRLQGSLDAVHTHSSENGKKDFWLPLPRETEAILGFLKDSPLPSLYARAREGESGHQLWKISHHQETTEMMRTLDGWKRVRENKEDRDLYTAARDRMGKVTIGGPSGGDDAPSGWTEEDDLGYLVGRAVEHLAAFNAQAIRALGAADSQEREEMDKRPSDRQNALDRVTAVYCCIR